MSAALTAYYVRTVQYVPPYGDGVQGRTGAGVTGRRVRIRRASPTASEGRIGGESCCRTVTVV
jgi:hypothetical protein